jgi:hypothetical protein
MAKVQKTVDCGLNLRCFWCKWRADDLGVRMKTPFSLRLRPAGCETIVAQGLKSSFEVRLLGLWNIELMSASTTP